MATPLAMVWDLIARDNASAAFTRVGVAAEGAAVKTEEASVATKKAGDESLIAGRKMDQHAKSAHSLAKALTAIAVVDIGYHMVKSAAQFQQAMLLIRTQAGATTAEVKRMTPAILALAGPTATAPEKLATSLYHVESIGLRSAKALDVVKLAAEGAAVGHADLEQTTNALTAAVASGIPGVQSMTQAMGVLNGIVGAGDMKMQDLNEALGSGLLTVVKQYGLSMNDVGAALATFGDNNIRGANAATMLRMAVQALAVPAKKGESVLAELGLTSEGSVAALAKLHLTVGTLARDLQTGGLTKALLDLKKHLDESGVSGVQVGTILTQTFGKRAGPGLQVLIGQLDRYESKVKAVRESGGRFGADWAATTKTVSFQWAQVKESLAAVGIEIGSALLPVVQKLANGFMKTIEYVHTHWKEMKPYVEVLGALTIAIGAVTAATAVWNAVLDANPISLIIIGIAAVTVGIIALVQHWKTVSEWVKKYSVEIAAAITVIMGPLGLTMAAALLIATHWKTVWGAAKDVFSAFCTAVQAVWHDFLEPTYHGIIDGIHAVEKAWHATTHTLAVAWHDTWNAIKTAWDAAYPIFKVIGEITYAILGGVVMLVLWTLKSTWDALWRGIDVTWRDVGKPVFHAIADACGWLWTNILKPILGQIEAGWRLLWRGVQIDWAAAKWVFTAIVNEAVGMWNFLKKVFGYVEGGWNVLWRNVIGPVWHTVGAPIFDAISTQAHQLWTGLQTVFGDIAGAWDALWAAFPKATGSVWDTITSVATSGINGIIDVLNTFIRAIDWILDKLPGHLHVDTISHLSTGGGSKGSGGPGPVRGAAGHGGFARGGVIPGYAPGVDSVVAMVSPGEGILVPEAVRALGGAAGIHAINARYSTRISGSGHYSGGGIIGDITGGVSGLIGGALSGMSHLARQALGHTLGPLISAAGAPVRAAINLLPAGVIRALGVGMFDRVDSGIRSLLFDNGGVLQPGATVATNLSGKPEAVLTNGQWEKIRGLANGGARGHVTVNQTIMNPVPEPASVSGPVGLRRAAYALGGP